MEEDKLNMHTPDIMEENFKKLAALFPSAVTETIGEDGKPRRTVDADVLRQLIDADVAEGREERYQFTWPEKAQSVLRACAPTRKTLRLDREKSVGKDGTAGSIDSENIYIEGDNLEALKILQETYLGKVKMIYIDPPYNTGNDFIYRDSFAEDEEEYWEESGQLDGEGGRLVQNMESSGRFHTNWLNMIYPRLWLARDLLAQDGVIFISIDDNEAHNLRKCCDDIFGAGNFVGMITWLKKRKGSFLSKHIISLTEYLVVYTRNRNLCKGMYGGEPDSTESQPIIKRTNKVSTLQIPGNVVKTKLSDGVYQKGRYGDDVNPVTLNDDIIVDNGIITTPFSISAPFVWSQAMFNKELAKGTQFVINTMNFQIRAFRVYDDNSSFKGFPSIINGVEIKGTNEDAYEELEKLFECKRIFDYSKPTNYIKEIVKAATHFDPDSLVLDFFSGSATTAHAVMQLNAEDGGHRRFIMIQLPEECSSGSEARKAGFANICEIGEERIRRAGRKIREENAGKEGIERLDMGFRVFKVDSSNMKDVWYTPEETAQDQLGSLVDNIKEDRTAEDLLFQAMLELGIELSADIAEEEIAGHRVFFVRDGALAACFDDNIKEETLTEIAKRKPLFAVLRDSGLSDDSAYVNFEQIFKAYSPETRRRVI